MDDTHVGATSIDMSTLGRSNMECSTVDGRDDFTMKTTKELLSTV